MFAPDTNINVGLAFDRSNTYTTLANHKAHMKIYSFVKELWDIYHFMIVIQHFYLMYVSVSQSVASHISETSES